MDKRCENYGSSWCIDFECDDCPNQFIPSEVEKLADILAEEEVKRKPDASDVRDTLITGYCQECPDHDEYDCADHKCFIWEIFGILMEGREKMKELVITYKLSYEPFLKHTDSGNCKIKCPLGDCLLNLVLEGSLDKVVQAVDIQVKEVYHD